MITIWPIPLKVPASVIPGTTYPLYMNSIDFPTVLSPKTASRVASIRRSVTSRTSLM